MRDYTFGTIARQAAPYATCLIVAAGCAVLFPSCLPAPNSLEQVVGQHFSSEAVYATEALVGFSLGLAESAFPMACTMNYLEKRARKRNNSDAKESTEETSRIDLNISKF